MSVGNEQRIATGERAGERFRHLMDQASDGIFLVEPGGRFVEVNPAACALLGYTRDELLHLGIPDVVPPAELEMRSDRLAALRAGQTLLSERHLRRKDGTLVPVEISTRMLPDGGYQGIARDISGRRQIEAELRRSEERLRLALEAADLETFDWDVRGRALVYSPGLVRLFGFAPEDPAPSHWALLRRIHPEDRVTFHAAARTSLGSDTDFRVQFRVPSVGGKARWLEARGRTFRDEDGRPARLIGTVLDVTDRKEHERQAARLTRAEKLQAIGQMASGVAHDLSQSLALIAGYTDLARETVARLGLDVPQLAEALEIAAHAATDAGESATRLLAFSRSQPAGEAQPVDVGVILREVARLTAPRWRNAAMTEDRPITLRVEVEGRHLAVRGWGSSLREAITNLVFNAVDALPHGGEIRLAAHQVEDGVLIEVADSGIGMPEDVREQAFEPFFTTKGEVGTGLGLYTVRQVIARHGGEIEVESAPGLGTTFCIKLPAAPAAACSEQSQSGDTGRDEAPLAILVVDDEPRLGQMLRTMLARHHVVTATSGQEALEHLAARPFDLVISDLGMGPGMNGWELAERVKRDWPSVRFVLATGWGATISEEEARERGVEAILTKPFSVRQLGQVIDGQRSVSGHAHRLQAGGGAGQHEPEVAAGHDELEALVGAALAVVRVAGGDAGDLAGVLARLDDLLEGAGVAVVLGLAARVDAHREGEVGRSGPAAVDAGHGHDRLTVLDGLDALDLDRHEELVADRVRVVVAVQAGAAPAPRAGPDGGQATGARSRLGLLAGVDHRDDDAHHAVVEQAADQRVVVARDAGHRDGRRGRHRDERGDGRVVAERAVLAVEQDEIDPGMSERLGGERRAEPERVAESGLAREHLLLGGVGPHAAVLPLECPTPGTGPSVSPAGVGLSRRRSRGSAAS